MTDLRTKLPKHVHQFTDRAGKARHYLRRPGLKGVPLPGLPWSPTFMAVYEAAMSSAPAPIGIDRVKPGSLRAVAASYLRSSTYLALKPASRQMYRHRIDALCQRKDSLGVALGDKAAAKIERKHIVALMETKAGKPAAANEMRKILRALMRHAVETGLRDNDPTRDVKPVKNKGDGFHSWTDEEIAQFEAHHPIGTKARLALCLLVNLGQRRGDTILMGRQHVRKVPDEDGVLRDVISVHQQKTGAKLEIPIREELQAIIAATPSDNLIFLTTDRGNRPFTGKGFGDWFRKHCDAAGLPHCSAHGLRKACARRLAEDGCSAHEIMAITGHSSLREAERYTKAVNQKRLAEQAIARRGGKRTEFANSPKVFAKGGKNLNEIKG